jgi:hypothetical protein
MLCYFYCKEARVHRCNDVPLVDAPPGQCLPDQYDRPWAYTVTTLLSLSTLHRQMTCRMSQVRPVCTVGQYCRN